MKQRNQKASKRSSKRRTGDLDIILPVYNERKSIGRVLSEWDAMFQKLAIRYRFIVCEDGSTDGTKELLVKLAKRYPILFNQKKERRGYGGAVTDGIRVTSAAWVLCIDSDGQCNPKDFRLFWKKKTDGSVLIGWRIHRSDAWQRKLFSFCFRLLFFLLFPTTIHDPSAPFVLFQRSVVFQHVHDLTFLKEGFWWGFVGMCVLRRIPLVEIPVDHRQRSNGQTNIYHLKKIPEIAFGNALGLFRLRLATGERLLRQ